MNPEQYIKLRRIDEQHWYYRGKRDIVRYWMDRFIRLAPDDLLLDGGMGAGTWAVEMAARCRVLGIDDHDESMALAGPRIRVAGGRVMKSGLHAVDLPSGCAAAVTLLDVIEHIEDDRRIVLEMIRLIRPGGVLVLTVPTLPLIWSDWDEVLHHRRRYTKKELLRLLAQPGLRVLRCAYFNMWALPVVAMIRWTRRRCAPARSGARIEDRIPPHGLNQFLYWLMVRSACCRCCYAPVGGSILAICRRTAE